MIIKSDYIYSPILGIITHNSINKTNNAVTNYISEKESEIDSALKTTSVAEKSNIENTLPTAAGINITNSCQLNCNYCTYHSGGVGSTLRFTEIKSFVDYLFRNAIIKRFLKKTNADVSVYFSGGGEPSFYWDVFKRSIEYIKEKSQAHDIPAHIMLTSNGMLSTEQCKYIIQNVDSVLISYDGLGKLQDKNRKSPYNKKTSPYVEKTLSYFNEYNYNFSIRSTVWNEDWDKLQQMCDHIFNKFSNVKKWEISPVFQQGRATNASCFTEENMPVKSFGMNYIELLQNNPPNIIKRIMTSVIRNMECSYNCGTSFGSYPWLDSNGNILTCLELGNHSPIIGRVENGNITCNDFVDDISLRNIDYINKHCVGCVAYRYCGGGCPLKNTSNTEIVPSEVNTGWICECIEEYWDYIFKKLISYKKFLFFELKKETEIDSIPVYKIYIND